MTHYVPSTLPVDCPWCVVPTTVEQAVYDNSSRLVYWILNCGTIVYGERHELVLERGRKARFEAR